MVLRRGSLMTPEGVGLATSSPLTPLGKPDNKRLREPCWGGPGTAGGVKEACGAAPDAPDLPGVGEMAGARGEGGERPGKGGIRVEDLVEFTHPETKAEVRR